VKFILLKEERYEELAGNVNTWE